MRAKKARAEMAELELAVRRGELMHVDEVTRMHDLYTIYSTATGGSEIDPLGPEDGDYHVVRGASFMDDQVTELFEGLRKKVSDSADHARRDKATSGDADTRY